MLFGRKRLPLQEWELVPGSLIGYGSLGGLIPEWADFLELSEDDRQTLRNRSTYALLFIPVNDRWFCITFGMGHVKLETAAFERDFGLRVALNEVDPVELRSIDVRSPDANTRMRRSQTSRGADQGAFGIDVHQDIMRVVAGKARSQTFASRVTGADSLAIRRKVLLGELPTVCDQAYTISLKDTYKQHFAWIDQIAHVRAADTIAALQSRLVTILTDALAGTVDFSLQGTSIYCQAGRRFDYGSRRTVGGRRLTVEVMAKGTDLLLQPTPG